MTATAPPGPPARPIDDALAGALWGAWWVDRRASRGEVPMSRLTFYRDHRFGARSADGRLHVYGGWVLEGASPGERAATGEPLLAHLALHFDRQVAPSVEFAVAFERAPLGPLVLHAGDATRVVLARAPAIEAALLGRWQTTPGTVHRARYALDAVELGADGVYVLRLAGGVVRQGRWWFERDADAACTRGRLEGRLALEPGDDAQPVERWSARVQLGPPASLRIVTGGDEHAAATLARASLDPAERALVGVWRRVAPRVATAPDELGLRGDGTLELLGRPGMARAAGRWSFNRGRHRPDALEGQLAIAVFSPGAHRLVHDHWHVVLPFARGGELRFVVDGERDALRYRRLFR